MAAGTRMKTMEENLKRLEAIVQKQHAINEQWVNSTNSSLNTTNQLLEEQTKRLEEQHNRMEERRIRMETMQLSTNQKVEDLASRMANWQQNNEQRFESLTSIVRNLSRERDQDPPSANTDSHLVDTGVNSVQGNVSANVNQRPNLVREAPGSSSMEWNRKSIDRSSAGGTELRGHVWVQGISMRNQNLEWKDSIKDAILVHPEVNSATRTFNLGINFASRAQAQNWEILGYLPAERSPTPSSLKVISNSSLEIVAFEMESEELGDNSMDSTENWEDDFQINSLELDIPLVYKLLDELPENKIGWFVPCVELKKRSDLKLEFCMGIFNLKLANRDPIWMVGRGNTMNLVDSCIVSFVWKGNIAFVFDPGGVFDHGRFLFDSPCAAALVLVLDALILVFDPGGEWLILETGYSDVLNPCC